MPSNTLKFNIVPAAAALVVALGYASPLWAQAPAAHPPPIDVRLAMMEMDDMAKMKKKDGMGAMPADAPMPGSDGAQDAMPTPSGSDMMGRMRGSMKAQPAMSKMAPASQLPGCPGASHLYHVGSTGFYLDHPQHITLSMQQQAALNRIKEKWLLDRATSERRIEDAEQEVWMLTAAEAPDGAKIEAKVRVIESVRVDQRLAFIRAVGEAGKVLSADQQTALLGTNPMAGTKSPPATGKTAPMPTAPAPMKMP